MAPSVRSVSAAMLATAGNFRRALNKSQDANLDLAASPLSLSDLNTQVGDDVALRVLPIGNDVQNAYHTELGQLLEKEGNKVEFVGTTPNGEESSKSETIDELIARAETSVPSFLPNVVIVNAGTADCEQGADGKEAGDKIVKLLEVSYDGSSSASVVLTTSVLPEDTEVQQCVNDVNNKIRNLADEQQEQERKVVLVDLDSDKPIETGDDSLPTKEGYKTIAQLLFDGIDDAGSKGWLEAPEHAPDATEEDSDAEDTSGEEESQTTPTPTSTGANARRQAPETEMRTTAPPTAPTPDGDAASLAFKNFLAILKQIQENQGNQKRGEFEDKFNPHSTGLPDPSDEELDASLHDVLEAELERWGYGDKNRRQEGDSEPADITANTAMPTGTMSPEEFEAFVQNVMDGELAKWGFGGKERREEGDESDAASLDSAINEILGDDGSREKLAALVSKASEDPNLDITGFPLVPEQSEDPNTLEARGTESPNPPPPVPQPSETR